MGKTIRDIRDSLVIEIKKYSDDIKLSNEFLYDKIKDIRATLIRDEIKTRRKLSQGFYQLVSCLEISPRITQCNSISGIISGYQIYVPGMMKIVDNPILYIGSHNFDKKYDIVGIVAFLSAKSRRYATAIPICTMIDDGIVFNQRPTVNSKNLSGLILFEDFYNVCGFDDDVDIPVPRTLIFKLETLVKKSILEAYGILHDPVNDDSEERLEQKSDGANNNN